jgi:tight adherence protein C
VRAARRNRVVQVERDLPLVLDLFSTLAEAGLSFDAALARILAAQPAARPLAGEFNSYRRALLAGVPREQAMRRLARRLDVTPVTLFTSALVQAEQVGASIAETLRHQAEDMRDRRRMNALAKAQALPAKLVFPLIVCFLPGIFVTTLGPALFEMVKVVDSVLQFRR